MKALRRVVSPPASDGPSLCRGTGTSPDCPAAESNLFSELVRTGGAACALKSLAVPARAPLCREWFETHGLALVRRGVVVRQRTTAQSATAVDVAGPGSLLPLASYEPRRRGGVAGYAASQALLCLCPSSVLAVALANGGATARELLRLQALALARMERIADARGRATAEERVEALVVALADTLTPGGGPGVPSGLLQRDLGALLGLRHESVCRALKKLGREGRLVRDSAGIRPLAGS